MVFSLKILDSRGKLVQESFANSLVSLYFLFSQINWLIRPPCAHTFSMFVIWKNILCKTSSNGFTMYYILSPLLQQLMTMSILYIDLMTSSRCQETPTRTISKWLLSVTSIWTSTIRLECQMIVENHFAAGQIVDSLK